MIRLESVHAEEVRGIRKLDLDFAKQTFAICGPNGSGKSGVIDAIEFGLTGQMGRLAGRGTKGLSVGQHGPHVDKVDFPDAAFVTLKLYLDDFNRLVTITRFVSSPKKPTIVPDEPAVRTALAEIADHPEITLSRRDILRFILIEPGKRSEEIQTLLKLDDIGQATSVLHTALNKLNMAQAAAATQVQTSRGTLQLHLQIPAIKPDALLEAVNTKRKILNLSPITALARDTKVDDGLVASYGTAEFNKESAVRDLKALADAFGKSSDLGAPEAAAIVTDLAKLEADPTLLASLEHRAFVEQGLGLVNKAECPLCDAPWPDVDHLKEHLKVKLARSEKAKKLRDSLVRNASVISQKAQLFSGFLGPIVKIAESLAEREFETVLITWKADLEALRGNLQILDNIRGLKARFEDGWLAAPDGFSSALASLRRPREVSASKLISMIEVYIRRPRTIAKGIRMAWASVSIWL